MAGGELEFSNEMIWEQEGGDDDDDGALSVAGLMFSVVQDEFQLQVGFGCFAGLSSEASILYDALKILSFVGLG